MRTRHRITRAVCQHENKRFIVTFQTDGVHIRQYFGRQERVIPIPSLVAFDEHPHHSTAGNGALPHGSPAETLDVAACDLAVLATRLHNKATIDRKSLSEVKASVAAALKLVRAMESLA